MLSGGTRRRGGARGAAAPRPERAAQGARSLASLAGPVLWLLGSGGATWIAHRLGGVDALRVPWGRVGWWLDTAAPADVLVALARVVALPVAWWLLLSTLACLVASLSGAPRALRAVDWLALPAVRRSSRAVLSLGLATATSAGLAAPVEATAEAPSGTPLAPLPLAGLQPGMPAWTIHASVRPRIAEPSPPDVITGDMVVHTVEPSDDLWHLSIAHMVSVSGRLPAPADHVRYWVRVCDLNAPRLSSGDPDLIHPGETVLLPRAGIEAS